MLWPDIVNGTYELLGAPFILLSVISLYKHKSIKGVHILHVCFFTTWGYWNLFYYPHLHQWCSFLGGIAIVIVNTIWMSQIFYYRKIENKHKTKRRQL